MTISSVSSKRSNRSFTSGKGIAYAACSSSNQPAPSPSSTRPPDISSTCATEMASGPGNRKVAEVTSVPRRMVEVSRPIAPRVIHESVGPGAPSTFIAT